jgi:hypothetical protein
MSIPSTPRRMSKTCVSGSRHRSTYDASGATRTIGRPAQADLSVAVVGFCRFPTCAPTHARELSDAHTDVRAHARTHTRTHTRARTRTHILTHHTHITRARAHTHTHARMHTRAHTSMRTRAHTSMRTRARTCAVHANPHAHSGARTHTHVHKHTQARTHARTHAQTHTRETRQAQARSAAVDHVMAL